MYAFFGLCILAGTALFGIAVSFLMRPVFIYRYMLPSMGCFWFGFVSLLSRQKKKRVLVPALVLLCLVGAADYSAFAKGTDGQDIGGAFPDKGRGCGDF